MDAKDVGKSKNFRAFAKEEETTKKKRYAIDETKTLVGTKGKRITTKRNARYSCGNIFSSGGAK